MPVAGLVVTLTDLDALRDEALATLASDARLTVGALQGGGRLPLVTDTATLREEQDLWNEIARTPGVLLVDLAFHDSSDAGEFTSAELPSKRRREGE